MLLEEIRNIKSEKKDLRNFGIVIGVALSILGGLLWWRGKDTYSYLFIVSAVFILFGLVLPNLLRPLQKVWMTLAVIMGWFMTRLILCVLFYLVFTPIGLITRLTGGQFLDLKMGTEKSYWTYRKPREYSKSDFEKQF